MDLYAENILDHYRHPRLQGRLTAPTVTHTENNPSCGDALTLDLVLADNHIIGCAWEGSGCAISQAGMSILNETLIGMTLEEAAALTALSLRTHLGVPISPRRLKCALLSLHTLKNALHLATKEPMQGWNETAK